MKVAIVCDWLTNQGGAERVVLELHKMFPDAPIYTSVYNPSGPGMSAFSSAKVKTSFIQYLPWAKTHHQLYPVLRILAFRFFRFSQFDLVISSSSAEAKGIRTKSSTVHINYCHSPNHYYWVRPNEYMSAGSGFVNGLLRLGLKILIKPMRRLDYLAAQRPDVLIANSTLTKNRIKEFYDRDSEVVFPPVETERFTPPKDPPKRHGFVSLGRQVHYMRRDIAVEAATKLGLLLRVIGRGPEHENLRALAGHTVEFYEDLNDQEVAEALWHAEGLITCGVEDFGITSVEAMAAGCPVIALKSGGVLDIITEKTGLFFDEQTTESLMQALGEFKPSNYSSSELIARAGNFSVKKFRDKITKLIEVHSNQEDIRSFSTENNKN